MFVTYAHKAVIYEVPDWVYLWLVQGGCRGRNLCSVNLAAYIFLKFILLFQVAHLAMSLVCLGVDAIFFLLIWGNYPKLCLYFRKHLQFLGLNLCLTKTFLVWTKYYCL